MPTKPGNRGQCPTLEVHKSNTIAILMEITLVAICQGDK